MASDDIRWHQRFANFNKALDQLNQAVELARSRRLSNLEEQGIIQDFEFTHELAWNVLKDYFVYQGNNAITGSRDAVREAFTQGLISKGEHWMDMIRSRNQSSHTYNEKVAEEIVEKIIDNYIFLFKDFQKTFEMLRSGKQGRLFD